MNKYPWHNVHTTQVCIALHNKLLTEIKKKEYFCLVNSWFMYTLLYT